MHTVKIAITTTARDVAQLDIRWFAGDITGLLDLAALL